MNSRIYLLVTTMLLLFTQFGFQAHANCPEPMKGETAVVVHYIPSENIGAFFNFVDEHLRFLTEQMQLGKIQYAGPFLKENGIDGGLTIFNLKDVKEVEDLVKKDPAVEAKVFSIKAHLWLQCSLPKK